MDEYQDQFEWLVSELEMLRDRLRSVESLYGTNPDYEDGFVAGQNEAGEDVDDLYQAADEVYEALKKQELSGTEE